MERMEISSGEIKIKIEDNGERRYQDFQVNLMCINTWVHTADY